MIAVILFPGCNCEHESKRVCEAAGMKADIVRWNVKPELLEKYKGYFLVGGWSYEDRIRAGVISAKEPIMDVIREQAKKGKPVLGICNGAQALVESGMIPGLTNEVEMALAPNINPKISGYYCTWVNLKHVCERKTAFNQKLKFEDVLPIPIAHGEGRFTTINEDLLENLQKNKQIMFQYCDEEGEVVNKFPINPNGAMNNLAAVCNKEGNVMAMMPHPERAAWNRQLPKFEGNFKQMESFAPGMKIFESMKKYIEAKK